MWSKDMAVHRSLLPESNQPSLEQSFPRPFHSKEAQLAAVNHGKSKAACTPSQSKSGTDSLEIPVTFHTSGWKSLCAPVRFSLT